MARPSQRNKDTLPDVQKAIYHSAVKLFAENGFTATSTKDIADCAKINKAMIYYYYENKEKLFKTIIRDGNLLFEEAVKAAENKQGDIRSRLQIFLRTYLENFTKEPELSQIIFRESMGGGKTAKNEIREFFSRNFEKLSVIMKESGEFKLFDPLFMAYTIFGMASMFIAAHFATGKEIEYKELSERMTEFFLNGAKGRDIL